MCLKIVEKDAHKDVEIKEGEVLLNHVRCILFSTSLSTCSHPRQCYLHPSRIPHSPQRFENTVGLVIERERSKEEFDGLR